jgi:3-hydroxy-9,10-secoandrosta-1,3,5(10)-triene-9,17-dione monooxygenase reductase component
MAPKRHDRHHMTSVRCTFVDHDFRAVMGHFCTGVAIVTGCNHGQAAGFVAQSVQSISLNPPLVSISPARTSTSWPTIRSSGYFALNFLTAEQGPLCRRFAQSSTVNLMELDGVRACAALQSLTGWRARYLLD